MHTRSHARRGVILIIAVVAMVVLFILSSFSLRAGMQSQHEATRRRATVASMHLAEAAADRAVADLMTRSTPPTARLDYVFDGNMLIDGGDCWYSILPEANNGASWGKRFTIIAYGQAANTEIQSQLVVQVAQQSFALYSYFTDSETSSLTSDTIWFFARDRLHGPVHTNDRFHISWDTSASESNAIFKGTVSSNASTAEWSPRTPSSSQDWRKVLSGGASAMTFGVPKITLPTSTDDQKKIAWGGTNYPSTNGVYVPTFGSAPSAGIYIRGDCTLTFSASGTTQTITAKQGSTTTVITHNLQTQVTTRKVGSGSTATYSGLTNGVIYCTGHITAMSGQLGDNYYSGTNIIRRNAWTVATDVINGKDVTINNSISYATAPDSTKPETDVSNLRAATLGVVARNVILSGTPSDLTLHGVYMAGAGNSTNGSLYYADWNATKRNNLNLLGGLIQKKRGPVSTFNGNTLQTGYNKNYQYDPRMMNTPPPFFPTTGQYDIKSWELH